MRYDSFSMPEYLKGVDLFVGLLKVSLFFSKDPVHLQIITENHPTRTRSNLPVGKPGWKTG